MSGDFNLLVEQVLSEGQISESEATFCLLDQHTFECKCQTVKRLAGHKRTGNKIELFYFLPIKWLHRALSGLADTEPLERWWGSSDWKGLRGASTMSIKDAMIRRFTDELGYKSAMAWPIFEREEGEGAVMYHMIHATDHPVAPVLMRRAYEKALTAPEPKEQFALDLKSGDYVGDATRPAST